jgi:hypothetical protein
MIRAGHSASTVPSTLAARTKRSESGWDGLWWVGERPSRWIISAPLKKRSLSELIIRVLSLALDVHLCRCTTFKLELLVMSRSGVRSARA